MPTKRKRRGPLEETERAARREKDRKLMAEAVDSLRSSEGWQRWLAVRRNFHSYSFHNQLLIAFQRPHATKVAGFRKWLALGYAVRKGERAIWIWAPCKPSRKRLERWRREGADPDQRPKTFFRMVAVFDRSQVDPLPDFPGGALELAPPIESVEGDGFARYLDPVRRFVESLGYAFSIEPTPQAVDGYCDKRKQRVVVRPLGPDFSANAQLATAVHEGTHALLNVEREDDDPELSYDEGEVVVECAAYSVCQALGLDTSMNSFPYVASWGKGEQIERYGALIDRLASRIEDAVLAGAETQAPCEQAPAAGSGGALALATAEAAEPRPLLAQAA